MVLGNQQKRLFVWGRDGSPPGKIRRCSVVKIWGQALLTEGAAWAKLQRWIKRAFGESSITRKERYTKDGEGDEAGKRRTHQGEFPQALMLRKHLASPCWRRNREIVGAKEEDCEYLVPLNSFYFPDSWITNFLRADLHNVHCANCPTPYWKIYPEIASKQKHKYKLMCVWGTYSRGCLVTSP